MIGRSKGRWEKWGVAGARAMMLVSVCGAWTISGAAASAEDEVDLTVSIKRLSSPDTGTRLLAIDALRGARDPRAIPALSRLMRDDSNPQLADEAIGAVRAIGGPAAVSALFDLAVDKQAPIAERQLAVLELKGLDPAQAAVAAKAVNAALRPKWEHALWFPPILYWLAYRSVRAGTPRRRKWFGVALFALAAASMIIVVSPQWYFEETPEKMAYFFGLFVGYPAVTGIVGAAMGPVFVRGDRDARNLFISRILLCTTLMWAALVVWSILIYVLMIFFFAASWGH